jgi:hypothetical protein
VGNACDKNDDGDKWDDDDDNCPKKPNDDQLDFDKDGIGNECDQCKRTPRGDDADGRGCGPGQKPDREID